MSSIFSSFKPPESNTGGSGGGGGGGGGGGLFSSFKPAEQSSSGGLFSTPKTTAPAAPSLSTPAPTGLFGATPAPTTTTTAAPASTAATATAPAPAPATAPAPDNAGNLQSVVQSRLKNRTMNEIVTRWVTDLVKYQKEFQQQAEQVAKWDRMLVQNGNRVQELYGNTVEAELATREVERQLATVENQQDELSSWLDRYEQEVNMLLSKQVGPTDALHGPDQDREQMYNLAQNLHDRLTNTGQDLAKMIEEINEASELLDKTTNGDEAITQIVNVMRNQLQQLCLIDQNANDIRSKINTSLQAATSYARSQGTANTAIRTSADDFHRTLFGRR